MMRVAVLLCLVSQAIAGPSKPNVSVGLSSDAFDKTVGFHTLEPYVDWETSGTLVGCDVSVRSFRGVFFVAVEKLSSHVLSLCAAR